MSILCVEASSDRVERTTNAPPVSDWTMACWVYPTATPAALRPIMGVIPSGSTNFFFQINSSNQFRLTTPAGGTNFVTISLNAWHYTAMRFNGTTATALHWTLDGVLTTASNAPVTSGTISFVRWGGATDGNSAPVRVSALKLWDTALSDAEIANERLSILPKRLDSLNDFYPCFPGATERLQGYAKGRTLTQQGAPTDAAPPPVSWGASPIFVPTAAAADPIYDQTKFQVSYDDGFSLGPPP